MSYILDALRRSERERLPGAPHLRDPGPALLPPRKIVLYAVPAMAVAAAVLGAYFVLGPSAPPPEGAGAATPAAAAPAPEPGAAPARAEEAEAAAAPAVKSAPPTAPARARSLAEQTRVAPPAKSAPQADTLPGTVISASPAPARRPARAADAVRLLRAMPPDFQSALPELAVTIHVYAANETERILYINNREYHAGDKVQDDIIVEQIVEDGAVLSFRGQRFKLPRPS